jgi:hypothetical protein
MDLIRSHQIIQTGEDKICTLGIHAPSSRSFGEARLLLQRLLAEEEAKLARLTDPPGEQNLRLRLGPFPPVGRPNVHLPMLISR